ncbi:MAG: histidine kinase [Bacteroidota bacterium]
MNLEAKSSNRVFFITQAIGWGLFGIANATIQALLGTPTQFVVANALISVSSGLLVSTIYRYLIRSRSWYEWRIVPLLLFILFSSFVLSLAWLLVSFLLFKMYIPGLPFRFTEVLANLANGGLIYLIWNLIYFFFKYFSKSQQLTIDKWRLAAEAKEAQLGNLRAHLRPHFVFNALNNIKALVLEDAHRSRDMLINFSDLLRYSLQHQTDQLVTLENELDISRQYLEIMSIQYEDRLGWTITSDFNTSLPQLPPLSLQMLVENAVKHGIAKQKESGQIQISAEWIDQTLQLQVSNPGSLKKRNQVDGQLGTGLQNLRERLSILYQGQARFELREEAGMVVAEMWVPQTTSSYVD